MPALNLERPLDTLQIWGVGRRITVTGPLFRCKELRQVLMNNTRGFSV